MSPRPNHVDSPGLDAVVSASLLGAALGQEKVTESLANLLFSARRYGGGDSWSADDHAFFSLSLLDLMGRRGGGEMNARIVPIPFDRRYLLELSAPRTVGLAETVTWSLEACGLVAAGPPVCLDVEVPRNKGRQILGVRGFPFSDGGAIETVLQVEVLPPIAPRDGERLVQLVRLLASAADLVRSDHPRLAELVERMANPAPPQATTSSRRPYSAGQIQCLVESGFRPFGACRIESDGSCGWAWDRDSLLGLCRLGVRPRLSDVMGLLGCESRASSRRLIVRLGSGGDLPMAALVSCRRTEEGSVLEYDVVLGMAADRSGRQGLMPLVGRRA